MSFAFPIEGDGPDCAIPAATVDCLQELLDVACTRAARLHPFGVRSDLAGVGPRQAIPRTPRTWSSIRRSPALTCPAPKPRKPPSLPASAADCAAASSHLEGDLGPRQLVDAAEFLQDLLAAARLEAHQRVLPVLGQRLDV